MGIGLQCREASTQLNLRGVRGLSGSACSYSTTPAACAASLPTCTQTQLLDPTMSVDSPGGVDVYYNNTDVTQQCNAGGGAGAGSSSGISMTVIGLVALTLLLIVMPDFSK